MLRALERALNNEIMTEQDIERLDALRYKIEREVMDAQVVTDMETAILISSSDHKLLEQERDKFFETWEPSEYDPNR